MPSDLPLNVSTFGADIDSIITFIWWTVALWFVATEGLFVYFLVHYRKRDGVRAAWMPADTLKAGAWVLIPVALVLVCDLVIEVRSHAVWETVKGQIPPHDELIRVTGRQFVWSFQYAGADGVLDTEDDFSTVSDLHVPRGKTIKFALESLDVLHSFWIPALRLKQDAVPGRSIAGWFEATIDGAYEIACAELCGPAHGAMRGMLTVQSPDAYKAWARALVEQSLQLAQFQRASRQ